MRISTERNGPSLAEVMAFTMVEPAADVARVEQLAANRMARVRGWVGWRVGEIDIRQAEDGLASITVNAEPVGPGYREAVTFTFLADEDGKRRSERLDAFLAACGVRDRVDDTREIEGRYFATRNCGRAAADFGPLTLALPA